MPQETKKFNVRKWTTVQKYFTFGLVIRDWFSGLSDCCKPYKIAWDFYLNRAARTDCFQSQYLQTFKEPRNQFQRISSPSLCSLVGQYNITINVTLILKMREVIFYAGKTHTWPFCWVLFLVSLKKPREIADYVFSRHTKITLQTFRISSIQYI